MGENRCRQSWEFADGLDLGTPTALDFQLPLPPAVQRCMADDVGKLWPCLLCRRDKATVRHGQDFCRRCQRDTVYFLELIGSGDTFAAFWFLGLLCFCF
jgi:hypothetical protein